ncbi:MAG TPA: hypothetical protein VF545_11075 [Thermoleophilaceae bacterium]|jgi:hypothetical protein
MAATVVTAGIVAKGLGIIAGIFGFGVLVGVVLTSMVVGRFRRR